MKPMTRNLFRLVLVTVTLWTASPTQVSAEDLKWTYHPELLRPFWEGDTVEGESVLFIRDMQTGDKTGEARASVLFPILEVLAVRNSAGDVTYENGKDYVFRPDSREIVLPVGSRITSHTPQELRRPAKSQQYQLTHRDGNGEILFGGRLQYAEMQTCITYRHAPHLWKGDIPQFDETALPRSIGKLRHKNRCLSWSWGIASPPARMPRAYLPQLPTSPAIPSCYANIWNINREGRSRSRTLPSEAWMPRGASPRSIPS